MKKHTETIKLFNEEKNSRIKTMEADVRFAKLTNEWTKVSARYKYTYNFSWMGIPIIQFPTDMIQMQEIICDVKPDLIIETGIAHGGSLVYYASLLQLCCGKGHVIGIDIDIRDHNLKRLEAHPMKKHITLLQGDSTSEDIVTKVYATAKSYSRILVVLDSNHTHEHVIKELNLYAPLVTLNSYIVVFDTIVENLPDEFNEDRPWSVGNNPMTAVKEFLTDNKNFAIDDNIDKKLQISNAPLGWLKRII